ncbi:MAG TPA: hydroxyacylglutathione hydrolase [Rhodocyclaceae bacterium]|nr:hydroxyacylglutathione hydrolase [Rhodocyclaceae bacterium]
MAIEIIGLPAFNDNYIWLLRNGRHVAAIDPGAAEPVASYLRRHRLHLDAILITHHHIDHTGGVEELLVDRRVPVYAPGNENIAATSHPLDGGERLELAELGVALDVVAVPGHTRGHLAYYLPAGDSNPDGALFCGDTLFTAGCGRLFEGTPQQMQASLARLSVLPAPTLLYCAHEYTENNLRFALAVEPDNLQTQRRSEAVALARADGRPTVPSRLATELQTNPFLRWDAPSVRAAAAQRLGHEPIDAVETFAAIRAWRNSF